MAIIKHISSKNSSYYASLDYLIMKHDEFTNKPILDDDGNMIPRDNYAIDCVNVSSTENFATECVMTNVLFNQNTKKSDVKSHHYIISFDPKDVSDNGLTLDKAQALGMTFTKKNFPGHQALVATHSDGHNNSGNIHIHIVINSVRKLDVTREDFMELPSDHKAGFKHHVSNSFLNYLKKSVMDMCQENSLYQVDLLSPSRIKITDAEYWKRRREIANGNTDFVSDKDYLRDKIYSALKLSKTTKDFIENLYFEYGITCDKRNEKLYYTLPKNGKVFSERMLGTDFSYLYVIEAISLNNEYRYEKKLDDSSVNKLIDIEANKKASESIAYENKLHLVNIENSAKTATNIRKSKAKSIEDYKKSVNEKMDLYNDVNTRFKEAEKELKLLNAQIRYTGQYWAYKDTYKKYLSLSGKKKETFYDEYYNRINDFIDARDNLRKMTDGNSLTPVKILKEKKEELVARKNELYELRSKTQKEYIYASNTLYNIKKSFKEPQNKKKEISKE